VTVTRSALDLPPNQLAGVLAHELGHHLGGHSWSTLLMSWYSLPGRLLVWVLSLMFRLAAAVPLIVVSVVSEGKVPGCLVRLLPVLWVALVTWFLYSVNPVLIAVWAIPPALAWFSRYGEKYADRVAADLGYGPALLEVLYAWLQAGHDAAQRKKGLRAQLLASHPGCAERIRALEKHLYGRARIGGRG
jgi:STE24 endopeptidase